MMTIPEQSVLILDYDPDIGELIRIVLADEGFAAQSLIPDELGAMVNMVRERRPDLIIVDIRPAPDHQPEHDLEILDALRADDLTRQIPVLATATLGSRAEAALASYNVREMLTKPFDLDELVMK